MELVSVADLAYGEFWVHYTYGSDSYSELGSSSDANKAIIFFLPRISQVSQITLGPNRFYLHEYAHQPVDSAFPGMTLRPFGSHFDRMNTWTKQPVGWSQHLVRSSLLLQNAVKITKVACFVGEELSASLVITYNSSYLVPLQYQADIFSRANLLNMTTVGKRASYPSGTSYSLLVFPGFLSASATTMSKVLELAQGGVLIPLLGTSVPSKAIRLNNSSADVITVFVGQSRRYLACEK